MKFLGIDYGTKRIGLAISDENGILAFPKEILTNDTNTFKKIEEIIAEERKPEVGDPPLIQALFVGVVKPKPKVLSINAHRKIKPIANRRATIIIFCLLID